MRRLNKDLVELLKTWGSCECRCIGLEYPSITPIGKLLLSPGRGTKNGQGPRYEPDPMQQRVNEAVGRICEQDRELLCIRYVQGVSDRVLALYCDVTTGKIGWAMEVAHRNIAKKLKVSVYR